MHTTVLDNDVFKRLSSDARHTFMTAVPLAGKLEQGGALALRGVGPLTVAEIAAYTAIPIKQQERALEELVIVGWLEKDAAGTYIVSRFSEKAGDNSTKRTRTWRKRHGNVTGTSREPFSDAIEEEGDKEVEVEENENVTPPRFNDLEPDVEDFIGLAAAENKTGVIAESRAQSLRRQLHELLEECSDRKAFATGLREANAKNKPNVNYVRACVRSAQQRSGGEVMPKRRTSRVLRDEDLAL